MYLQMLERINSVFTINKLQISRFERSRVCRGIKVLILTNKLFFLQSVFLYSFSLHTHFETIYLI